MKHNEAGSKGNAGYSLICNTPSSTTIPRSVTAPIGDSKADT